MASWRRRVVTGALALAAAGAVAGAVFAVGDPASSTRSSGSRTSTVRSGTVTASVTTSGTVASATSDELSFQQSGTVTAIYVKVGQKVAKGDKLAAIDDSSLQLSLKAAEANLTAAEAGLASAEEGTTTSAPTTSNTNAADNTPPARTTTAPSAPATKSTLAPTTTSPAPTSAPASAPPAPTTAPPTTASPTPTASPTASPSGAVTTAANSSGAQTMHAETVALLVPAVAETASASASVNPQQVASAQSQVYSAQSQVASAKKALAQAVLTAPVAGTIQAINGSVGGSSSGSSASNSSSPTGSSSNAASSNSSSSSSGFITLTDLVHLQVKGDVAEADIDKVKVGQPVTFSFSAGSATTSTTAETGSVEAIDVTSTVTNNVVEYGVTMSIANPPSNLRLGQTASATIQTGSVDNALSVPSSAITTLGNASTVQVLDGKTTRTVTVTLGLVGDTSTQIVNGLTEGQTVVLPTTTSSTGTTGGFPGLGGAGGGLPVGGP